MNRILIRIDSLAAGGEGVGRWGEKAVFVPGTAQGELVEVEMLEIKERLCRGRPIRVVEQSDWRRELDCPSSSSCGGCSWGHLEIGEQRRTKQKIFQEAFERLGGFVPGEIPIRPIVHAPPDWKYRQRVTLHREGSQLGYRKRASHELTQFQGCALLAPRLEAAARQVQELFFEEGGISGVQDIALASDEKRVSASLIGITSKKSTEERVKKWLKKSDLSGLVLVSPQRQVRTLGKPILCFPAPRAHGITIFGRPDLFAQANQAVNELLVQEALRQIAFFPSRRVEILELYSGAGNFTFGLVNAGARVTAIEANADAVELARKTARQWSIDNVRFIIGDALHTAEMLAKEGRRFQYLLLDPPRAGAKGIGKLARQLEVRTVVYVSCEPTTLARDLRELKQWGYLPKEAVPVDMFPQTFHIEGVVTLVRD